MATPVTRTACAAHRAPGRRFHGDCPGCQLAARRAAAAQLESARDAGRLWLARSRSA